VPVAVNKSQRHERKNTSIMQSFRYNFAFKIHHGASDASNKSQGHGQHNMTISEKIEEIFTLQERLNLLLAYQKSLNAKHLLFQIVREDTDSLVASTDSDDIYKDLETEFLKCFRELTDEGIKLITKKLESKLRQEK